MEAKVPRRIALGPNFTFLFENRDTVRWQIQEMCRIEGLRKPVAIQHELEAYNPLIPGDNELSATLLIEYADEAERDEMLVKLSGLDNTLTLEIDGQAPVCADFESGREVEETGKVSAVQFIRFPMTDAQRAAFCEFGVRAALKVTHSVYEAETPLRGSQRGALIEDVQSD